MQAVAVSADTVLKKWPDDNFIFLLTRNWVTNSAFRHL